MNCLFSILFLFSCVVANRIDFAWSSQGQFVSFSNIAVTQLGSHYSWSSNLKCDSPLIPLSCSVPARLYTDQLLYPLLSFTDNTGAILNSTWLVIDLFLNVSISASSAYLSRAFFTLNSSALPSSQTLLQTFSSTANSPLIIYSGGTSVETVISFNFSMTNASFSGLQPLSFTLVPNIQFLNYGNFASTINVLCTAVSIWTRVSYPLSTTTPSVTSTMTSVVNTPSVTSTTTSVVNTPSVTMNSASTTPSVTTSSASNTPSVTSTTSSTSNTPFTNSSTTSTNIPSTETTRTIPPNPSSLIESSTTSQTSITDILLSFFGACALLAICMIIVMYPVYKLRKRRQVERDKKKKIAHESGYAYPMNDMASSSMQSNIVEIIEPLFVVDTIQVLGQVTNSDPRRFFGITSGTRHSVILHSLSDVELSKIDQRHLIKLVQLPSQQNLLEVKGLYMESPTTYLIYENVCSTPFKKWWYQPKNFHDASTITRLYYAICMATAVDFLHDYDISLYCFTFGNVLYTGDTPPYTLKLCPLIYADIDIGTGLEDFTYAQQCGPPEILEATTSSKDCDMWYLGLLIWHFFEIGIHPFGAVVDIQDIHSFLITTNRQVPVKPKFASDAIYDILKKCWRYEASQRISSTTLVKELSSIYEKLSSSPIGNSSSSSEHQYVSFSVTDDRIVSLSDQDKEHIYCNIPPTMEK